ncbi:DsbA family oxidoreductase [Wenyingzhuangia aestuarii]|uniref:DsbA family oxidoreductase n=1 Tax=Wenyingzhuangia aestuarii TaxID=1647582 RepID=UPI00143A413F|nr:DsbA family oxidoreductase [Wenyingzhuangia aestuarii]NJB83786.1 putative DsbA family dithiol-disulfide isomerase [Wenyingzhuangia aestuarii]
MKTEALQIDLIYDIICPWCYVGHQRLVNAIKKTNAQVQIHLIPFQIRPNLPESGISIQEYWEAKGVTNVLEAYEKVIEAGESENLDINPNKFSRIPNTLKIHQVILKAEEKGVGLEVLHVIQTAYFTKGEDLTALNNLIKITKDFLSEEEVVDVWNDDSQYKNAVLTKEKQAKALYIKAVPTYIVAQKHRVSGAVSNFTLVDMLNQLAPKEIIGDFCDVETGKCETL